MPVDTHETHNPFATFAPLPVGVTFEGQEQGEKIILLLRAHIITLVPAVITTIFLFLVPIFFPSLLSIIGVSWSDFFDSGQIFLITVFWSLFVFGYAFYRFIFWYFNVYLITNERVVDIDFRGLLHKEVAYAKLNQIQDVSPKTIGFFGTFFHYGDIYLQTAGAKVEFEFHHVPRPNEVARQILEQVRIEEGEPPGKVG